MEHEFLDLEDVTTKRPDQYHRWIQPPQIAYFVTSMDKEGNINSAPVTMGTTICSPDGFYIPFAINDPKRQAFENLVEVPECVISYIGADHLEESWVAALPIPRGISELDVAGLTPLPSRKVRPCGIRECAVNLEARVVSMQELGPRCRMFVSLVVGASIGRDYLRRSAESEFKTGVMAIDPLFEVLIERASPGSPPRLHYAKLDRSRIHPTSEDLGSSHNWIGTFEEWMNSEKERGRIDEDEHSEIMDLYERWRTDRSPERNAQVKDQLTAKLKEAVWRTRDRWPG